MHLRHLAAVLVLSFGVAACGGGSQPAPAPTTQDPATAPAVTVDPATAATIAGKINLEGTAPANAPIRMNADPACVAANKGKNPTQETFVGEAGGLGNVFVYVQSGRPARSLAVDAAVFESAGLRTSARFVSSDSHRVLNRDATLLTSTRPRKEFGIHNAQPIRA